MSEILGHRVHFPDLPPDGRLSMRVPPGPGNPPLNSILRKCNRRRGCSKQRTSGASLPTRKMPEYMAW